MELIKFYENNKKKLPEEVLDWCDKKIYFEETNTSKYKIAKISLNNKLICYQIIDGLYEENINEEEMFNKLKELLLRNIDAFEEQNMNLISKEQSSIQLMEQQEIIKTKKIPEENLKNICEKYNIEISKK